MRFKKILQIGCGGIGSYFIDWVCRCIDMKQIEPLTEITIADHDMVELRQIRYQNFGLNEAGMNKAQALARRFKDYGIKAISRRIENESQLRGYDLIILCVDNEKTRELAVRYCHRHDKEFLDLRATGRRIFAMPKEKNPDSNLKFIDSKDTTEYSCQDRADLEKGYIQLGNVIIALWGCQMLLNLIRGHDNRTISMVV